MANAIPRACDSAARVTVSVNQRSRPEIDHRAFRSRFLSPKFRAGLTTKPDRRKLGCQSPAGLSARH